MWEVDSFLNELGALYTIIVVYFGTTLGQKKSQFRKVKNGTLEILKKNYFL